MRVIIVGGGIMGLCTAWALHRAGHEPALFEQGPLPNPLASSTDQHRLIRFTYGAMTGYARMVHGGLWRVAAPVRGSRPQPLSADRDPGGGPGRRTAGSRSRPAAWRTWASRSSAGAPRTWPAACRSSTSRAPATRCSRRAAARCSRSASCAISRGQLSARGVALHEHAPVREVDPARALIRTADGREHRADAPGDRGRTLGAAAAAGARRPGHPLAPGRGLSRAAGGAPAGLAGGADAARSDRGDRGRLLCRAAGRRHRAQGRRPRLLAARRSDRERTPTPDEVAAILALAATRLRDFERYRVSAARTCFYAVSRRPAVPRRALRERLDPRRLLRPRLQVRRRDRRADRGHAGGRSVGRGSGRLGRRPPLRTAAGGAVARLPALI